MKCLTKQLLTDLLTYAHLLVYHFTHLTHLSFTLKTFYRTLMNETLITTIRQLFFCIAPISKTAMTWKTP